MKCVTRKCHWMAAKWHCNMLYVLHFFSFHISGHSTPVSCRQPPVISAKVIISGLSPSLTLSIHPSIHHSLTHSLTHSLHNKYITPTHPPLDPEMLFLYNGWCVFPDTDKELVYEEVAALQQQCEAFRAELALAQARLNTARLGVHSIQENDDKCLFYTGLSWSTFLDIYDTIADTPPGKGVPIVAYIDQFFTLVKLRHNVKFEYLSDQAGVAPSTMVDHFWKWMDIIYVKLEWFLTWPDWEYVFRTMPPHFKRLYPRLTCIRDCFEIFVEPSNLKACAELWSNYKKHTIIKFLIGCSTLGAVTFLSQAWGGRVSDIEIVKRSGFLTAPDHHPGDQILADRGFILKDDSSSWIGTYHPSIHRR